MSYRKYKTTPISDDQSYRTPPFFKDTQFPVLLQCSYNLGLNVGRKYATLSECLYYVVKNVPFCKIANFRKHSMEFDSYSVLIVKSLLSPCYI